MPSRCPIKTFFQVWLTGTDWFGCVSWSRLMSSGSTWRDDTEQTLLWLFCYCERIIANFFFFCSLWSTKTFKLIFHKFLFSVTTHTETYNDTGIWAACFRSLVVRTGHCCKKQTGYGKCYAALTHKQILIHHMVTVNRVDWTRSMCMRGASLDFACVHSRKFIFSYVEKQFQEVPLNVVKNRINFIVF